VIRGDNHDATHWGATCWIITRAPDAQQHEVLDEHPIALGGGEHSARPNPGTPNLHGDRAAQQCPRVVPVGFIMGGMA
jgi:hypothetical protein